MPKNKVYDYSDFDNYSTELDLGKDLYQKLEVLATEKEMSVGEYLSFILNQVEIDSKGKYLILSFQDKDAKYINAAIKIIEEVFEAKGFE